MGEPADRCRVRSGGPRRGRLPWDSRSRTMRAKHLLTAGLLVAAAGLVPAVRGDDTIRLNIPAAVDAPTLRLDGKGVDADTVDVRGYYRGGFRGGYIGHAHYAYRGHYWGGYRGYYAGYRGFYGYGYRGFYGYPYYAGYRGFYGCYAPSYYSYPSVYYVSDCCAPTYYYLPISSTVTTSAATVPLTGRPAVVPPMAPVTPAAEQLGPPAERRDPTYPYDGGPTLPVPMPGGVESAPP